jgi:hypothetical protein
MPFSCNAMSDAADVVVILMILVPRDSMHHNAGTHCDISDRYLMGYIVSLVILTVYQHTILRFQHHITLVAKGMRDVVR